MNARLRPWAEISRRSDDFGAVRPIEDRLDRGGVFAGADQVSRGAAADQQADRADQDGLAGAGLAGEDVEARLELELEAIDDGQIADAKGSAA